MPLQDWNPGLYQSDHSFVWRFGEDLVDLLDPKPGQRILDVGCGTGQLTEAIARRGAGVIGIDSSRNMIDEARRNNPQLDFRLEDATNFSLDQPVDAVFSNAALHWIRPPRDAARCMARALRVGGRLVVEFGGYGNVRAIVDALHSAVRHLRLDDSIMPEAKYFPSIAEYAGVLQEVGLEVRSALLFDRPTPLKSGKDGLRGWLRMFYSMVLDRLPPDQCEALLDNVEQRLHPILWRDDHWIADYRRLRIVAVRMAPDDATNGK